MKIQTTIKFIILCWHRHRFAKAKRRKLLLYVGMNFDLEMAGKSSGQRAGFKSTKKELPRTKW